MGKIIIGLLGSIFLSILWIHVFKIHKKLQLSFKPFNCGFCLAFWFSLAYFCYTRNWVDAIYISSITPFIYLIFEDIFTDKWEF